MNEIQPYLRAISQAKDKFITINSVNNFVNYESESMFAMQIVQSNDYLMGIANKNPQSLRDAVINLASIGLSLNPSEKLVYLVPRKGRACLDVSYIGLIRLATDSGSIMWVRAELVYENDSFIYKGATEKPEFSTPNPFDRGELKGVYCCAKTSEGDYLTGIMSKKECYEIRNRSEAYKAYVSKKFACSWTTDEGEMIKKTIIKRESKTWPKTIKSERLNNAIEVINQHEGIEFENQVSPEPIDYNKVEMSYIEAIRVVDIDDLDEGAPMAQEIIKNLSMDEQIALHKKLQNYKPGKRKYSGLFKEYLKHEVLPDLDVVLGCQDRS